MMVDEEQLCYLCRETRELRDIEKLDRTISSYKLACITIGILGLLLGYFVGREYLKYELRTLLSPSLPSLKEAEKQIEKLKQELKSIQEELMKEQYKTTK
ncbi:MAG: hypothetical protein HY606_13485 [Planctomycetes bacterium]|nr:hypothetical protein [Planctomycetota bacterium]